MSALAASFAVSGQLKRRPLGRSVSFISDQQWFVSLIIRSLLVLPLYLSSLFHNSEIKCRHRCTLAMNGDSDVS